MGTPRNQSAVAEVLEIIGRAMATAAVGGFVFKREHPQPDAVRNR